MYLARATRTLFQQTEGDESPLPIPRQIREALIIVVGTIVTASILLRYPLYLVIPVCLVVCLSAWVSSALR